MTERISVTESRSVPAAPGEVWNVIGRFTDLNWHPAVAETRGGDDGKTRTLLLEGGGEIVEALVDENDKSYTYQIVDAGPLPVDEYESSISVAPDGGGSKVTWTGSFVPHGASGDEAEAAIRGVYVAGLDNLPIG